MIRIPIFRSYLPLSKRKKLSANNLTVLLTYGIRCEYGHYLRLRDSVECYDANANCSLCFAVLYISCHPPMAGVPRAGTYFHLEVDFFPTCHFGFPFTTCEVYF